MQFSPDITRAMQAQAHPLRLRMGFDLVQISQVTDSVDTFGEAYTRRLFTPHELDYAGQGGAMRDQRLAARFAAKEAVIKALQFSEAGVGWREIEVRKLPGGDCELVLHGQAQLLAKQAGVAALLLSLSHDGDYAGAVVTALFEPLTQETCEP